MSLGYYLYCKETHQCVHVATTSSGCPTGTQAHHMAIQFFTVAHSEKSVIVTTGPDEVDPDAIEWNLGNCIELFCRMTGDGECIKDDIKEIISKYLSENPKSFSEYTSPNWLYNYTADYSLGYFGLIHQYQKK